MRPSQIKYLICTDTGFEVIANSFDEAEKIKEDLESTNKLEVRIIVQIE